MSSSPQATIEIKVDAATGEYDWAGKEEGLCYCGATTDEHERAFMNYYIFGNMSKILFPEGATSEGDMYADHYPLFLDYMSTSEFVDPVRQKYFEKELRRWQESGERFRKSIEDWPKAVERARRERHASCVRRSKFRVLAAGLLTRAANGTHRHSFYETIKDLRCRGCGAHFSDIHDLGPTREGPSGLRVGGRRIGRGTYHAHECCIRCGAMPQPFWVSKGTRRLRAWGQVIVESLRWARTQAARPVPLTIFSVTASAVLSNLDRAGSWWPF